jgi:hypothetical protein
MAPKLPLVLLIIRLNFFSYFSQRLFVEDSSKETDQQIYQLNRLKNGNELEVGLTFATTYAQNEGKQSSMTKKLGKRRKTAVVLEQTRSYIYSIVKFLNKQSYLLSLISMMVSKLIPLISFNSRNS